MYPGYFQEDYTDLNSKWSNKCRGQRLEWRRSKNDKKFCF